MPFSLPQLRMLVAVGEWKSISRAAEALGVSQPAISKAVRAMEREAGVQLLVVLPRGVKLTEAGETLCLHGRAILSATHAAEADLAAFRRVKRGVLRVAASTTIARYYLPPVLAAFVHRHPGVEVRLDAVHSRYVARLALDRQCDVALAEAPPDDDRLAATVWGEDELALVAAADHPLALPGAATTSALSEARWLLREPGSGGRSFALAGLARLGVEPSQILTVDDNEVMAQLAIAGVGLAVVSAAQVSTAFASGQLVPIMVPGWELRRPLYRLALHGRRAGAAVRAFEGLLELGAR